MAGTKKCEYCLGTGCYHCVDVVASEDYDRLRGLCEELADELRNSKDVSESWLPCPALDKYEQFMKEDK